MRRRTISRRIAPLWQTFSAHWSDVVRLVSAHPRRVAGIGAVCAVLLFLVATTTLPMALAPTSPDLARALDPRNPVALQRAAEAARTSFLALDRPQAAPSSPARTAPDTPAPADKPAAAAFDSIGRLPEARPPLQATPSDTGADTKTDQWREKVRQLATELTVVDPLNPVPFRMRAEVAGDPDEQRRLMLEAAKRSRRDRETLVWLLQDELDNKRYDAAIQQADMLLRTQPQLQSAIAAIFGRLAEDPAGRPALVQWLLRSPEWRQGFFQNVNRAITQADTPFRLMEELRRAGQPPTAKEVNQYLLFLLAKKFPEYAYNVWVQTQPPEVLGQAGFLNNPGFDHQPSGGPFDWTIDTPRNAVGEFIPLPELGGERVFHVVLGSGRVRFPQLSQTLLLPAGRYRLTGKLRGSIVGKRGLLWQVRCLYQSDPPLGQTEPLLGQSQAWRLFGFDFEVPKTPDCAAQTLRLFHDSRSASEEVVGGEAWFDNLSIQRIGE